MTGFPLHTDNREAKLKENRPGKGKDYLVVKWIGPEWSMVSQQ